MSFPNITTKTKNFEATADLLALLEKRLSPLERVLPRGEVDVLCDVELEKVTEHHHTGKIYRAEINMSFGSHMLRAEATEESMETAIDRAKNDMRRELEKIQSRTDSLFKRGARRAKEMFRFGS